MMRNDLDLTNTIKKMLTRYFDMNDIGIGNVLVEIKISKTLEIIVLSQSHFVTVLKNFQRISYSSSKNSSRHECPLKQKSREPVPQLDYSKLLEA